VSAQGALLFARYAYPPNELGYCGPDGAAALLQPDATAEIGRRARQFEGAWCYLQFIADAAGISDPLDARVVEAYWVGNDLLSLCEPQLLTRWLGQRFQGQVGGTWIEAGQRAQAHHSFQVFEVYPWAQLLAASSAPVALSVLDRCRIRVGIVLEVDGESARVHSSPLVWDGSQLARGDARSELVRWSTNGRSLLPGIQPGNRVALHWDWVCDLVSDEQARSIETREAAQFAVLGVAA
jgi:Family of unknown function (DUF6390)